MTLSSLIERVEAASGPDDKLHAEILCALLAPEGSMVEQSRFNGRWCVYEPATRGNEPFRIWQTPNPWRQDGQDVTESLDAVIALCERVLPADHHSIYGELVVPSGVCEMSITLKEGGKAWATSPEYSGVGRTPALALLLALLRAKQAMETGE